MTKKIVVLYGDRPTGGSISQAQSYSSALVLSKSMNNWESPSARSISSKSLPTRGGNT